MSFATAASNENITLTHSRKTKETENISNNTKYNCEYISIANQLCISVFISVKDCMIQLSLKNQLFKLPVDTVLKSLDFDQKNPLTCLLFKHIFIPCN